MNASIAIVGEFDPGLASHSSVHAAIGHAADYVRANVRYSWIATCEADPSSLAGVDGVWMPPGESYANPDGSLEAIRYARVSLVPCLGTCRGFQHMVLEFARNVLGKADASHGEYEPDGKDLYLTKPHWSVRTRRRVVEIREGSALAPLYPGGRAIERFYGSYVVNPDVESKLAAGGFVSMASDPGGNFRVGGIPHHPFFFGSLFIPQMRSTGISPHPLVLGLVKAATVRRQERIRAAGKPGKAGSTLAPIRGAIAEYPTT